MDYDYRMMLGGGPFFWLIPLTLVLLVLYTAYKAFAPRRETINVQGNNQSSHALEILKSRYAKGEIGQEEYERMKKEIEQ